MQIQQDILNDEIENIDQMIEDLDMTPNNSLATLLAETMSNFVHNILF